MNGGEALVETLVAHGVEVGFTVPGESFLTVLEALRRRQNQVRLVLTRHESGGSLAADAYAKLTRKPAAVFVSRGPGATNASIGVHTAMQDSTPMLLFVGNVRVRSKGRESFQEVDHHRLFGSLAKAVIEPASAKDIAECTARAWRLATAGRPGPVVMVLPRDLTEADAGEGPLPKPVPRPTAGAAEVAVRAAAAMLARAKRPLILAGECVSYEGAHAELVSFAEATGAPVIAAYRRQDAFPNEHAAYAGHLEINRVGWQKKLLDEADVLIAVGSRLDAITSEEYTLPRAHQSLIMLHPEAEVVSRFQAEVGMVSDLVPGLRALAHAVGKPRAERLAWRDGLHRAYLDFSTSGNVRVHGKVDLSKVTAETMRQVGDDAVLLTDGGSFARWIHRYYRFRRPYTQAGPAVGAMGYAVPGAVGAILARPQVPVVAFAGDGSFLMTGQEMSTAAEQNLPIRVVVCDNRVHGSILQGQRTAYGEAGIYGTRISGGPDFAALARAYGCGGFTVERTEDYAEALRQALAHDGPALIHVKTDERDIVPFGAGIDDKV